MPWLEPQTFLPDRSSICWTCSPTRPGYGLHVGHPLGYIGTDVYGRYHRMAGWNVLHTLGFDAFGLPAEQYAVQQGQHPRITTEANIANYRRQLRRLGLAHDQRRSIATTDPTYYRWTQWIFAKIFESWYDADADRARPISELVDELATGRRPTPDGRPWTDLTAAERQTVIDDHRLAYLADGPVNWCPGLGTVLANEEVTADGRSDIGNFPVFRRTLRQWMLRITAYADRLLDDLDALDWPESIKIMQRNWIGRSHGATIRFATRTSGTGRVRHPVRSRCSPPDPTLCSGPPSSWWRPNIPCSTRCCRLPGRPEHHTGGEARPTALATRSPAIDRQQPRRPTASGRRTGPRPGWRPARRPSIRRPAPRSRCSSPTTC